MLLPQNGKIVVIDDDLNEGLPLVKALSKNNIAVKYFTGLREQELPDNPIPDIRYIFLDIVLGTEGSAVKTKIGKTITVLSKILGTGKYTPYILVFWTKERPLINRIIKALPTPPVAYFDLEKINCKKISTGEFDIIKIENNIKNRLTHKDVFKLFTVWENIIHESTGLLVNDICTIHESNEFWETNIRNIIFNLAKAQLGDRISKTSKQIKLRNTLYTLNRILTNLIEKNVLTSNLELYTDYDFENKKIIIKKNEGKTYKIQRLSNGKFSLLINNKKKGEPKFPITKLASNLASSEHEDISLVNNLIKKYLSIGPVFNTRILLDLNPEATLQPGNVYEKKLSKKAPKRKYLSNYFTNIDKKQKRSFEFRNLNNFKFIELEVTPICDYTQDKWLKSRILPGIIYKPELYPKLDIKKTSDSLYKEIPVLFIFGGYYKILFDFRLLKSIDKDKDENRKMTPLFKINQDAVNSIISRLASHVSRIGLTFLE